METEKKSEIIPGLSIYGVTGWNVKQNRIALVAALLILGLIIIPPWGASTLSGMQASVGHYIVFSSTVEQKYNFPSVDYGRLILEMIGVIFAFAIAIFVSRTPKDMVQ